MPGEKRDGQRLPVTGEVRGEVMLFQPMTLLDIGLRGAQIETSFPLHVDTLHDFRLTVRDRSVIVKGRIAHSHIGQLTDLVLYRSGVEFLELTGQARAIVADFVAELSYSRSDRAEGLVAGNEGEPPAR